MRDRELYVDCTHLFSGAGVLAVRTLMTQGSPEGVVLRYDGNEAEFGASGVFRLPKVPLRIGSSYVPACLMPREIRRRSRSTSSTFTRTVCPTRTTSAGSRTNRSAIWLT